MGAVRVYLERPYSQGCGGGGKSWGESRWRTPWRDNTRMPIGDGRGNTDFPMLAVRTIRAQLSIGGIM
jgi:hypothetical protein